MVCARPRIAPLGTELRVNANGESPNRVVLSVVGIVPAEIAVVLVLILILILVS